MDRLTGVSKILRKNMTREERYLWYDFLKDLPLTVNRQKVLGRYIVDFFIASKKTVIELDGTQHFQGEGPSATGCVINGFRRTGSPFCGTPICRSTGNLTLFVWIF